MVRKGAEFGMVHGLPYKEKLMELISSQGGSNNTTTSNNSGSDDQVSYSQLMMILEEKLSPI